VVTVDAVAVRFQVLPEVIDLSFVLVFSGAGGLVATLVAALLRFDSDPLAKLVLFGNLFGAGIRTVLLLLGVLGLLS
jgi:hypothetical protein